MPLREKARIMEGPEIDRALSRITHEILERNRGTENLVIVGIRTKGVYLAQRIAKKIREIEKKDIPLGTLDITLYRDDIDSIEHQPIVQKTEIPFDIRGKDIVLVDDVLYTGRTIRAAMDELIDFGRPKTIQLAVLIDRGHRELPIRADYVGKDLPTSRRELVEVKLEEVDRADRVIIYEEVEETP